MQNSIDWLALKTDAVQAAAQSYSPYSQFPVGVAVLGQSGQIYSGCNVENASYGATVCAERHAIAAAVLAGERSFQAILVYTPQEQLTPPCGICRQVIAEFCTPDTPIATTNHLGAFQQWTLGELLPAAFTPTYLNAQVKK